MKFLYVLIPAAVLVTGCATVQRAGVPKAAPQSVVEARVPSSEVVPAPLAPEMAGLREDLYRVAGAVRTMKARIDSLSAVLASTDGVSRAGAELRGQREALLAAAAGLRDAKGRVDVLEAGWPTYEAALARLRAESVAATDARNLAQKEAEAELQKLRATLAAEQVRLQGRVDELAQEVKLLKPRAEAADEVVKLKQELKQEMNQKVEEIQGKLQRAESINEEREKQIQKLRDALKARPTVPPVPTPEPAAALPPEVVVPPPAEPVASVIVPPTVNVEPQPVPVVSALDVAQTKEAALNPVQQAAAANVALRRGDLARALILFRAALARDDTLVGARIGLAACAYSMDDMEVALRRVDEVLATDAHNAQALGLRGIINWKQGRLGEAEKDAGLAVAGAPADAQLRNYHGIILHAAGRSVEAVKEIRKAVELDPANGEAMLNLAILLATEKPIDVEGAADWYRKALAAGAARDEGLDRLLQPIAGTP